MTVQRTAQEQAYVTGLRRAYSMGRKDASLGRARNECPYRRLDYRKCWHDGFDLEMAERRSATNQS